MRTFFKMSLFRMSLAAFMLVAVTGCPPKSEKTGDPKPAKTGDKVEHTHDDGAHGGHKFHFEKGHDVLAELVVKDGKIAIFVIDHDDPSQTVEADDKEIKITGVKHDGKDLGPIVLKAMKKDKKTWFEASGDAVPKEIKEAHDLNGGTFTVKIGGKERKATISEEDEDEHEEHSDHKSKHSDHDEKKMNK